MQQDLNRTIEQVTKEKGIDREVIVEALESAMVSAAKKTFGVERSFEAQYNPDIGEIELFEAKLVVEDVEEPDTQIRLSEARETLDPDVELGDELLQVDVVVTATGAPAPVLLRASLERVMRARRNRPLFIIDVGLPRDVEPACGDLEQVFLYNIDDLRTIVSENLARRRELTSRAEALVAAAAEEFVAWLRSRGAIPTVIALRRQFEAVRRAEIERLEPKLSRFTPEARARVEEITRVLVQKLLLTPTERLKSAGDAATAARDAEAVTRLFDLDEKPSGASSGAGETEAEPAAPLKTPVAS